MTALHSSCPPCPLCRLRCAWCRPSTRLGLCGSRAAQRAAPRRVQLSGGSRAARVWRRSRCRCAALTVSGLPACGARWRRRRRTSPSSTFAAARCACLGWPLRHHHARARFVCSCEGGARSTSSPCSLSTPSTPRYCPATRSCASTRWGSTSATCSTCSASTRATRARPAATARRGARRRQACAPAVGALGLATAPLASRRARADARLLAPSRRALVRAGVHAADDVEHGARGAARARPSAAALLLHAGAGGVGLEAVEYAHWLRARVVGTAGRPHKHARCVGCALPAVQLARRRRLRVGAARAACGSRLQAVLNSLSLDFIAARSRCSARAAP